MPAGRPNSQGCPWDCRPSCSERPRVRGRRLVRVGSDDFEVNVGTQCHERVGRAPTGMPSAHRRAARSARKRGAAMNWMRASPARNPPMCANQATPPVLPVEPMRPPVRLGGADRGRDEFHVAGGPVSGWLASSAVVECIVPF